MSPINCEPNANGRQPACSGPLLQIRGNEEPEQPRNVHCKIHNGTKINRTQSYSKWRAPGKQTEDNREATDWKPVMCPDSNWKTRCKQAKNKHQAVGKHGFSCDPTLDDDVSGTKIRQRMCSSSLLIVEVVVVQKRQLSEEVHCFCSASSVLSNASGLSFEHVMPTVGQALRFSGELPRGTQSCSFRK